jgi:hypothetical protein
MKQGGQRTERCPAERLRKPLLISLWKGVGEPEGSPKRQRGDKTSPKRNF